MPGPGPRPGGPRPRGPMGQPEKMDKKSLSRMLSYSKKYMIWLILAVVCSFASSLSSIIGPKKIAEIMNIITDGISSIDGINIEQFLKTATALMVFYLICGIVSYIQQLIISYINQDLSYSLRRDINLKINRLPLKYFDSTSRGEILSKVSNDVDTISSSLGSTAASVVSAVITFIGVLFVMFRCNITLSVITIMCSMLGFVLMASTMKISRKYFRNMQDNYGQLEEHVEETYSCFNVVKSFNGEDSAKERFDSINNELSHNGYKGRMIGSIVRPFMGFSSNLGYAAIFIVGVSMILNGSKALKYGDIISFTMYSRNFSQPLNTVSQSISTLQQASAAARRVFELLDSKELEDESEKKEVIDNVKGDVEFDNVVFGYDEDKEIIHGFNAHLKAGQKVAIVGPTGAGKTTMVNLLMRFYEVNSGSIKIDGIDTKLLKRENVRDLFDMILQDSWLFEGTIRENLIYNQENVSDERLDEVCRAVGLHHFIEGLADGYDTILNDKLALSQGQKQQLTIARAMIKDSPLLILDEATSSVDSRTEVIIQKAMDELTKGRTSFIIAHRLSTIRNADVILVMNHGDIVEMGNHQQLLEKNGFYAQLYNSQFEAVE